MDQFLDFKEHVASCEVSNTHTKYKNQSFEDTKTKQKQQKRIQLLATYSTKNHQDKIKHFKILGIFIFE